MTTAWFSKQMLPYMHKLQQLQRKDDLGREGMKMSRSSQCHLLISAFFSKLAVFPRAEEAFLFSVPSTIVLRL